MAARGADPSPQGADAEEQAGRDPSQLVRLLRSDAVQRELRLTREQRAAIDALVSAVEYPLFQLRDQPVAAKRAKLERIADQIEKTLGDQFNAVQQQRLYELILRAHGWPAVLAPQQVAALKLTTKQVEGIRQVLTTSSAGSDQNVQTRDDKILKLLSPAQQSELTKSLGSPFDFARVPQIACRAPELRDVSEWLNSPPLTLASLRGRVVALHFFAFGCSNCIHNQPHYLAWHEQYKQQPVTVLGLHTPETERERSFANLQVDVKERKLPYPIAVDAQASNWNAWSNNMWPSVYLIDKQGFIRYWWYGELNWQGARGEEFMRKKIDELLAEPAVAKPARAAAVRTSK